jgi:hypothetical protein
MQYVASQHNQLAYVFFLIRADAQRKRPFLNPARTKAERYSRSATQASATQASQPDAETKNQKIFDGEGEGRWAA